MLASFIPTQYLGSSNGTCVTNFDQTAYIAGLSSDLFNVPAESQLVQPIIGPLGLFYPQTGIDLLSAAVPNPFLGVAPGTFLDSKQALLKLVDGGEDGEVIPIQPLLVKARGIDVIIAIDSVRMSCCYV